VYRLEHPGRKEKVAREKGNIREIKQYWIDEERRVRTIFWIMKRYAAPSPRYWEDVKVGDEIPKL